MKASNRLGRADRGALGVFIILGALIVLTTAAFSVRRIIEVLGANVPMSITLTDVDAVVDIGASGIAASVNDVTVIATHLKGATSVFAILEPVLMTLTVTIVVTCIIIVARRLARGQIFSTSSTALVATAGLSGLIGSAAVAFAGSAAGAGTLIAEAGDEVIENIAFIVNPFAYVLSAFIVALIISAFSAGNRLQRDTEGLV